MSETAVLPGAGITAPLPSNPTPIPRVFARQVPLQAQQHAERGIPTQAPQQAPLHRESAPRSPGTHAAERHALARRQPCPLVSQVPECEEPAYLPLSNTTDRVLRMLLEGDLSRLRAESVAEALGISCTTLRRRLRNDHTSYQFLLDRARQYRCEARLRERWLPGKCLADELGYLEINSFYRAFRRWTGLSYSQYKLRFH